MNPVNSRQRSSGPKQLDKRQPAAARGRGQLLSNGLQKNSSNPRNPAKGPQTTSHNTGYLRHTTQSVSQMAENMLTLQSDDESEAELVPKRTRRNKKTITEQDKKFVCGCKKTYLSYAALYTHTKVKHQGIFPEGTDTGIKKKQGRPKKLITSAMVKTAKILRKKKDFEPKVKELLSSCGLLRKPEDHYNPADHFPGNDMISEKLTKPLKEAFLRLLKESKSLLSQFKQSVQHDISEIQSVEGVSIAESGSQSQWLSLIEGKSKASAEQKVAWEIPTTFTTKGGDSTQHHQVNFDHHGLDEESGEEEVDALDFIKEAAQLASDTQIPSKLHPITAAGKKPIGEALSKDVKDAKDTKKAYSFSKLVIPVLVESLDKKDTTATDCFCLYLFFLAEWLNPKAFTEAFILLAAYRGLLNLQGMCTELRIREEHEEDQQEQHAMKGDAHEDGSSLDSQEMDDGRSRGARSETFKKPKLRHSNHPDELDILPIPLLSRQVSTHSTNRSSVAKTPRASAMFNLKKAQAPDFSDSHSADVTPDLANEFCTSYLPDLMAGKIANQPALQAKNICLFGKTKEQKHATIYFVKLLCNWLCSFGFSEGNVELDKASLGYTQSDTAQTMEHVLGTHPATEY